MTFKKGGTIFWGNIFWAEFRETGIKCLLYENKRRLKEVSCVCQANVQSKWGAVELPSIEGGRSAMQGVHQVSSSPLWISWRSSDNYRQNWDLTRQFLQYILLEQPNNR